VFADWTGWTAVGETGGSRTRWGHLQEHRGREWWRREVPSYSCVL